MCGSMQSTLEVKRLKTRPRHLKNWECSCSFSPRMSSLGEKGYKGQPRTLRTICDPGQQRQPQSPDSKRWHLLPTDMALSFLTLWGPWLCTNNLKTLFIPETVAEHLLGSKPSAWSQRTQSNAASVWKQAVTIQAVENHNTKDMGWGAVHIHWNSTCPIHGGAEGKEI